MKLVENAAGRMVPDEINGKEAVPFKACRLVSDDAIFYFPSIKATKFMRLFCESRAIKRKLYPSCCMIVFVRVA